MKDTSLYPEDNHEDNTDGWKACDGSADEAAYLAIAADRRLIGSAGKYACPKQEKHGPQETQSGPQIVTPYVFFHVDDGEWDEYGERDYLLDDFQLSNGQGFVSHSVGRNLQRIFEKCNAPACQDGDQ